MEHRNTGKSMAVKVSSFNHSNRANHRIEWIEFIQRIRSTVDELCRKQMLNELDIVMKENTCPYIVQFCGVLFKEVRRHLNEAEFL
jgi:desulfoferrodoxin (superoxide reductase-like protein)